MSGIIAQNSGRHTGLVKASSGGGVWNLIETLTSDGSDSDLSFTSGIDSTYDEYVFKFIDIHPETDGAEFQFNMSIDSGSNYNVAKTATFFQSQHDEGDTYTNLGYLTAHDSAQATGFQDLGRNVGNDNDQSCAGYLHLFNPSSDVFIKHFIARLNNAQDISSTHYSAETFIAGYGNTTSAVDAVQFKMSADEIQGGSISLYGIS